MKKLGTKFIFVVPALAGGLLAGGCSTANFADGRGNRTRVDSGSSNAIPAPFEADFTDGSQSAQTLQLHAQTKELKQSFNFTKAPAQSRTFTQMDRPEDTTSKTQGKPGQPGNETLAVVEARKLDILVVVDNTPGSKAYQDRLAQGLPQALSAIDFADWQMAVVSASGVKYEPPNAAVEWDPCLVGVINQAEWHQDKAGTEQAFADDLAQIGEQYDGPNRGIEMAIGALNNAPCQGNAGTLTRKGSVQVVLFLAQEDNCAGPDGSTCESAGFKHYTADDFVSATPPGTRAYSLLRTAATCAADPPSADPSDYLTLASKTGASWTSVCQADYSQGLTDISNAISSVTQREFNLQQVPDAGSVKMYFTENGQPAPYPFSVTGQHLDFTGDQLPPPDTKLSVAYTYGGTPTWQAVTLDRAAVAGTLAVTENGQEVPDSQFTYDPAGPTVSFTTPPPQNALVVINYRVDEPLQKSFSVGETLVPAATSVYVNDVEVPAASYAVAQDAIVFEDPPADSSEIRVVFNAESDYVTHYQAAVQNQNAVDSFQLVDAQTGAPLACTLSGTQIVCPPAVVETLANVTAIFETRQPVVVLPEDPVPNTVQVSPADAAESCSATYDRVSRQVSFSCPGGALPAELKVSFQFVQGYSRNFSVTGAPTGTGVWHVLIDGTETTDYTRVGTAITITDRSLAPGSHVTVKVVPPQAD